METLVRLDGVSVRFGATAALDRLDLEVERGEAVALMGSNGAGKSTTLRVVIGQVRPSRGRVLVDGLELRKHWQRVKRLIGYVPDRDNHFDGLTGRANLGFFAGLYDVGAARVDQCLELLGLSEVSESKVRTYTAGMKRKLLVARAILHRPTLLLLDEPTANLDQESAGEVRRMFGQMVREGSSVLLTTHDPDDIAAMPMRVVRLDRGTVVGEVGPSMRRV